MACLAYREEKSSKAADAALVETAVARWIQPRQTDYRPKGVAESCKHVETLPRTQNHNDHRAEKRLRPTHWRQDHNVQ